jgi:predicted PP-loop superfamily ATPase
MEASARHLEGANMLSRIEDASDERRRCNLHIQQQVREYDKGTTNRRFQRCGRCS